MKQGRASHSSSSGKTEPRGQGVSPGAVSRIGIAQSPFTKSEPMFKGRGLEAPTMKSTVHHGGSQGKHK